VPAHMDRCVVFAAEFESEQFGEPLGKRRPRSGIVAVGSPWSTSTDGDEDSPGLSNAAFAAIRSSSTRGVNRRFARRIGRKAAPRRDGACGGAGGGARVPLRIESSAGIGRRARSNDQHA